MTEEGLRSGSVSASETLYTLKGTPILRTPHMVPSVNPFALLALFIL